MSWSGALVAHSARDRVVFDPDLGAFRRDPVREGRRPVRFRGVIPVLEQHFFGRSRVLPWVVAARSGGGGSGLERGQRVDTQLEELVRLMHLSRVTPSKLMHWASRPPSGRRGVSAAIRRAWVRLLQRLDVLTLYVIRELARRSLMPVQAQCPVASGQLRVATAVDLVCTPEAEFRWTGPTPGTHLVLVEVKTGYAAASWHGGVRFRGPFRDIHDTPTQRHRFQLALTAELFRRCVKPERRGWVLDEPLLLYVRETSGATACPETVDRVCCTAVWTALCAVHRR